MMADIDRRHLAFTAGFANLVTDALQVFDFAARDQHRRSGCRELLGYRLANPGSAAGDDGNLAFDTKWILHNETPNGNREYIALIVRHSERQGLVLNASALTRATTINVVAAASPGLRLATWSPAVGEAIGTLRFSREKISEEFGIRTLTRLALRSMFAPSPDARGLASASPEGRGYCQKAGEEAVMRRRRWLRCLVRGVILSRKCGVLRVSTLRWT